MTEADYNPVPSSGDTRWEERREVSRNSLKEEGLLRSDSPKGTWELSEVGWEHARGLCFG